MRKYKCEKNYIIHSGYNSMKKRRSKNKNRTSEKNNYEKQLSCLLTRVVPIQYEGLPSPIKVEKQTSEMEKQTFEQRFLHDMW